MCKVVYFLAIVALSMAAQNVQKREVFISSNYPVNTLSYNSIVPSVYYGGSPFIYGSPFYGSPFVTFEKPKEKKEGEEKKEEKVEEKKEAENKEEGDKKDEKKEEEVKTVQYIIPSFSSYPFWYRK
ncbi:hypothetical protein PFISCL1PPCAC_15857 [Pristionchus fissidentatus]|uniref:Uncharacterized protein n=1 Tax=Pristionchus fissidentatus TaxID=1538716 RepID=A0AAV5VYC7_9BILA|nr:hypothetical protein PFISCL1PPCAC_15857 [Pristionchus fissidentatus]